MPDENTFTASVRRLLKALPRGSEFAWRFESGGVRFETWTVPQARRGRGTELLARILAEADRSGLACSLDADPTLEPGDPSLFDLVRWYRRFGFEAVSLDSNEWVRMTRDPRPWRGGHGAVLSDYACVKATSDLTPDGFASLLLRLSARTHGGAGP